MSNPRWTLTLALSLLTASLLTSPVSTARGSTNFSNPSAAHQTAAATKAVAEVPAVVMTIPDDYQEPAGGWMPRCSADHSRCGYRAQKGNESFVVVNGVAGVPFAEVGNAVFSSDGRHVAYTARRDSSWMIVADDKPGPPFEKIDNLMFRGAVPIYLAARQPAPRPQAGTFGGSSDVAGFRSSRKAGVQAVMIVGDREDEIPVVEDRFTGINDLNVSPDGKTYLYVIRISAGPYGLWMLMVNGEQVAEDHGIRLFGFTRDGRIAFARRTGSATAGRSKVQVGNEEAGGVRPSNILGDIVAGAVSPDGRTLVFVACTGKVEEGACALMQDAKVLRQGAIENPAIAPNGITIAYTERQPGGRMRATVGAAAGPPVDALSGGIIFSPDSKRHAYVAKLGDKSAVVVDGTIGPEFDSVDPPRFSADSKHLAYTATKGGAYQVVLNQVAAPATFTWATAPDFDAARRVVKFVALEGRTFSRRTIPLGPLGR